MATFSFINQNVSWRWTYYALIIWSFLQTVALICVGSLRVLLCSFLNDKAVRSGNVHAGHPEVEGTAVCSSGVAM
jgi:hypothetical protein